MTRSRKTFAEIAEIVSSMPLYDRRGRRILRRSEWERLPRWRRWRDVALGWDPPREWRYPSGER